MSLKHNIQKQWIEQFNAEPTEYKKISYCTSIYNRVKDIALTLPINLKVSTSYPNLEFVVVDFNSTDGLEDWVKENMMEYIESGRLVYYKTEPIKFWDMSYCKNVCHLLADGEIVNNLDADNYVFNLHGDVPNAVTFAHYLNRMAHELPEKTIFIKSNQVPHGRIGFYKKDFIELGGHDEDMKGYGVEDFDIVGRAIKLGYTFACWRKFYSRIYTHKQKVNINLEIDSEVTKQENLLIYEKKRREKRYIANKDRCWGKATVIKNFKQTIKIGEN